MSKNLLNKVVVILAAISLLVVALAPFIYLVAPQVPVEQEVVEE